MKYYDLELSVGDVIQLGEHTVEVIELHGVEVTFKICQVDDFTVADDSPPALPR